MKTNKTSNFEYQITARKVRKKTKKQFRVPNISSEGEKIDNKFCLWDQIEAPNVETQ